MLATGGFGGDRELVARYITPEPLALRANPWSAGDGLRAGLAAGGALTSGMDEFYGRNMPDAPLRRGATSCRSRSCTPRRRRSSTSGAAVLPGAPTWSETDVVQATARQPGARAWYLLDDEALDGRGRRGARRTAREAGAPVVEAARLPFAVPRGTRLGVYVHAAITHTMGGLRVDEHARVLREDGSPLDGLYAAGVDAGGVSTGGYASGLAQALVLGLAAAEHIC